MPSSMTGYGAGRASGSRVAVEAEVRSVNSRSLKISVRTPPVLAPREADLEAIVRKRVRRGSVTVFLRVEFLKSSDLLRIRPEVVEGFALALDALRRKGLVEGALTPESLAALPGAVESGAEDPLRPADWKVVRTALEEALAGLEAMRGKEAAHLVKDLRGIAKRMGGNLSAVAKRAPVVVDEYRKRLKDRVDLLLRDSGAALDEATLAREVAVYADRCDVTGLQAHRKEFDGYLKATGEVGRTLDFLAQEMHRETNTIGSKSQDTEIARRVIALKSDVDRLKEQVANLE